MFSIRHSIWLLGLAAPLAAQQPTQAAPPQPAPQQPALRAPVADTGVFAPLYLPDPNELRRPSGAPGTAYWQQKVDYSLAATLDTTARKLTGTVTIRYANRSPDTLAYLWLQMDQNLFRAGSVGGLLNAASSRFGAQGFDGGFTIESIYQTASAPRAGAGRPMAVAAARRDVTTRDNGTMMKVNLGAPVAPGASTTLQIAYHFNIPDHGADRMG
ncbi:MAG: hypothetical protein ABI836_02700, partial [Gemmatimonadota bacterium]